MAGQRQKHPDTLVHKRGGRYRPLAPVTGWAGSTPRLPRGMSARVRSTWAMLWRSPLAGAFKETDVPTLTRWAWWFDQWLRVSSEVAHEPLTVPGRGGPVLNPKARFLKQCESALRELERAFGMDALARLRLGITLADNQTKAQALRAVEKPTARRVGNLFGGRRLLGQVPVPLALLAALERKDGPRGPKTKSSGHVERRAASLRPGTGFRRSYPERK